MKNIICSLVALLLCVTASAQGKFVIESDIVGLPESGKISVTKMLSERNGIVVDTLTITDGKFRYEGISGGQPERYSFNMLGDRYPSIIGCDVWVWNNRTVITGDSTLTMTWTGDSDLPRQKELATYTKAAIKPLKECNLAVYQRHWLEIRNDPALKTAIDSLQALVGEFYSQMERCQLEAMTSMPVSDAMISRLMWITYMGGLDEEMRQAAIAQYERFDAGQRGTINGLTIRSSLFPEEKVKVGSLMADGMLVDIDGNFTPLAIFAGKYILLDFWSVACANCREAEPEMKQIFDTHGDKVAVVGINCDAINVWKEYGKGIAWHNLSDGQEMGGIVAKYGVEAWPTYLLIDPQGVVVAREVGYKRGMFAKLLKEYKVIE